MFIDSHINIPDKALPKILREDMRVLQEYYDKKQESDFDLYLDGVEASIKQAVIDGYITREMGFRMFDKYGI